MPINLPTLRELQRQAIRTGNRIDPKASDKKKAEALDRIQRRRIRMATLCENSASGRSDCSQSSSGCTRSPSGSEVLTRQVANLKRPEELWLAATCSCWKMNCTP